MLSLQAALTLSSLFHLSSSQTISVNSDASTNEYLNTEVEWGTPPQKFNVLVDTTDHTSWVYNQSANTDQPKMNTQESSTFAYSDGEEVFSYQNEVTPLQFAHDTFAIGRNGFVNNTAFALATENFTITDDEGLSGILGLDRSNAIIPALHSNGLIQNQSVTIDVLNNKLHFGPYTPSSYDNVSNATSCQNTSNSDLSLLWAFPITISIDDSYVFTDSNVSGVIDAASPYITVYAKDDRHFELFFQAVDKTTDITNANPSYHCNYTTRECSSPNDIMNTMTIVVDEVSWNITIPREDMLSDDYIQVFYDGDRDYTTDVDYVLFLGRPFLKQLAVTLDYKAETMTFYGISTSESSLNWVTIAIVFGSVGVFALLFFGVYYWKYGRIPPPTNSDAEEQSHSLLRGPVQAVGSGQGVIRPQVSSAAFSGPSGLDEDDEDYQRQLQQVQRQSAIEAQQRREQQMREERERQEQRMVEEQKQQAQLQQAQSAQQQRIGGSAPKPDNADDLRQRRLKYLDSQKQLQPEDDDDNII